MGGNGGATSCGGASRYPVGGAFKNVDITFLVTCAPPHLYAPHSAPHPHLHFSEMGGAQN